MNIVRRGLAVSGWRGRGLDLLIGAIAVLGHAPFHIWIITIVGFAWLMGRLDFARQSGSGGFGRAMWFGLGHFMAGLFWIGSAFIARGPEFIPAMPPMILGLAALLALFWAAAGWAYVKFFGSGHWRWAGLTCLLMGAELARGHFFGGLPWNLPGYIFKAGGPMSQGAAFVGIYGLSFLVLIVSACLARVLFSGRHIKTGLSAVIICGLLFGGGMWRLSQSTQGFVEGPKLRLVQVPFSQADKFDPDTSIAIVREFIRLSQSEGLNDITHLIWPEGAVTGVVIENEPLLYAMGEVLTQNDPSPPYWIFNTLRHEVRSHADVYYNSAAIMAYDKSGEPVLVGYNDKRRLVPFGEFIPGGKVVEDLGGKILSTSLGSITPASTKELSDFPGLPRVSAQICYEIVFSRLTPRPKDQARAEWILNQTNDAWFGTYVGPFQHANIAAYRAIEEGIPVIRSASNGMTGAIDPYGRYLSKLEPKDRGVLDVYLPQALPKSYLLPAHNMIFSGFIILAIFVLWGLSREKSLRDLN